VSKRIAVSQSDYIPWKGYFDLINSVDEFVLYDDAQFTRRDWRNRNLIKTPSGLKWLTIPVETKGRFLQKISETRTSGTDWPRLHWSAIVGNYSKAPHFDEFRERFEALYIGANETMLSRINHRFLTALMEMLGISTVLRWSNDYSLFGDRSERLLNICKQAGAETYVSGPSARDYLDLGLFERAGVRVEWMDYSGYPPYRQLHGAFEHGVSVIDLLANEGTSAPRFMKSFHPTTA
jgi:hypothetical protein